MKGPLPFFRRVRCEFALIIVVLGFASGFPVGILPLEAVESPRVEVVVADYSFTPRGVNVRTGVTVVWNYSGQGTDLHTVTSENQTGGGSPLFASPNLAPGYTYSLVFSLPGVYRYFCAVHPTIMRNAWVNVTGPPLSDNSAPWYGTAILVVGGIGAAAAVGTITIVLVRRRRRVEVGT